MGSMWGHCGVVVERCGSFRALVTTLDSQCSIEMIFQYCNFTNFVLMFPPFDQRSPPVQLIPFGNSSSTVACKTIFSSLALAVYFESICRNTSILHVGLFEFFGLLLHLISYHFMRAFSFMPSHKRVRNSYVNVVVFIRRDSRFQFQNV